MIQYLHSSINPGFCEDSIVKRSGSFELQITNLLINDNAKISYPKGLLYTTPEVSGQCKSTISPSMMTWGSRTSVVAAMTAVRGCEREKRVSAHSV